MDGLMSRQLEANVLEILDVSFRALDWVNALTAYVRINANTGG